MSDGTESQVKRLVLSEARRLQTLATKGPVVEEPPNTTTRKSTYDLVLELRRNMGTANQVTLQWRAGQGVIVIEPASEHSHDTCLFHDALLFCDRTAAAELAHLNTPYHTWQRVKRVLDATIVLLVFAILAVLYQLLMSIKSLVLETSTLKQLTQGLLVCVLSLVCTMVGDFIAETRIRREYAALEVNPLVLSWAREKLKKLE